MPVLYVASNPNHLQAFRDIVSNSKHSTFCFNVVFVLQVINLLAIDSNIFRLNPLLYIFVTVLTRAYLMSVVLLRRVQYSGTRYTVCQAAECDITVDCLARHAGGGVRADI